MKKRPYIKVILISVFTLAALFLLYIFDVKISDGQKYTDYVSIVAVLIVAVSFGLLVLTMRSKDFKQWLDSVSRQADKKENQLTKKQVIIMDIFTAAFGILLIAMKYVQNIIIDFGHPDVAKFVKNICFHINVAYFVVLPVIVLYTFAFIKEQKEGSKKHEEDREPKK